MPSASSDVGDQLRTEPVLKAGPEFYPGILQTGAGRDSAPSGRNAMGRKAEPWCLPLGGGSERLWLTGRAVETRGKGENLWQCVWILGSSCPQGSRLPGL